MAKIVQSGDVHVGSIETVSAHTDLTELVAFEKFMEQPMEIEIAAAQSDNEPPCVVLNVNGVNQPVWRGQPVAIRRKYVEVLARMKETRYHQQGMNHLNPEAGNALHARTALVYPFQVLHDPHPKGGEWLRAILAERA